MLLSLRLARRGEAAVADRAQGEIVDSSGSWWPRMTTIMTGTTSCHAVVVVVVMRSARVAVGRRVVV